MANSIFRAILLLTIFFVAYAGVTFADTFEQLTYTPPAGWTNQATNDGSMYRRPNGIGLIAFYASQPATGVPADEFARIWRARVESTLPGAAPQPQIQRDGDHMAAVGTRQVNAKGTITTISLVAIVGRGRTIGVLTMSAGDDVLREITAFLDSIKIGSYMSARTTPGSSSAAAVDFEIPPGYVAERSGPLVVLKPAIVNRTTPCVYGVSPGRPSRGSLDADARAAILEALPGWQLKSDHYNAMRGTSGGGWPYYWFRTDVQQLAGANYQYLTAMTMAFPDGQGQVNVVWGFGATGVCMLDDQSFLHLFHSLRPRGWTTDGGKALGRELVGTWRDTHNVGMAQYRFMPNGRYEYGLGTSTTFGNLETRTGSVGDGRYELRGGDLIVTPDARGRSATKYRVRVYDEFLGGVWRRAISLMNESARPATEVQYMRVDGPR